MASKYNLPPNSIIHVQLPRKDPDEIMKILYEEQREQMRYTTATGTTTNFRLGYLSELIERIEKLR